jgi:orotate phosphoribosyltransferase
MTVPATVPRVHCGCGRTYKMPDGVVMQSPGLLRKGFNFALASVQHIFGSARTVDDPTREWRLSQCLSCTEFYDPVLETCTHIRCGCGIRKQRGIFDKLSWASERCPIGRWDDPPPRWITNADMARDTLSLVSLLPADLAGVVAVPRSGMLPASILATHLHLPLLTLHGQQDQLQIEGVGNGWRLANVAELQGSGPLLVIDDSSMSGATSKQVRDKWPEISLDRHGISRNLIFGAVYTSPEKHHRRGPMPDIFAAIVPWPHLFEWHFFNSGYIPSTALDFDGILTKQDTSEPLYLPRKWPVPLIITGRLERDRAGSEWWLAHHGIRVERLVMYPGTLQARDQPGELARFKAEHFAASGLRWFVESEPDQAAEISRLTHKQVVCPAAGRVFDS